MSSSRIIKFSDTDGNKLESFPFQSITKGIAISSDEPASTLFVPMALFDNSESNCTNRQLEPEPQPDGTFITDDELEHRLRESFENGLVEGKNLAERGLFNAFKALRTSSEQILSLRDKVLKDSEEELINLVMLLARKIIIREISQDRSILANIVHNAIAGLPEHDEISVRLNPDDYTIITTGHDDILSSDRINNKMTLKSDPTIMIGCCKIETVMGIIDATIDSQLDEIYRYMKEDRASEALPTLL